MKKFYCPVILLLCCLSYSQVIIAQDCPDLLRANKLYYQPKDIINGPKWISEKIYSGSPMLVENYWPKVEILYNGILYKEIPMNYDLTKDEIVIYDAEKGKEKYVVINKSNLSKFSYTDSLNQRHHLFEYKELSGTNGKFLYENLSVGRTSFFIKPLKKFSEGKFSNLYKYYIDAGIGFVSFTSRSQLIKLLTNHRAEVNKYLRKNNLKIDRKHPEDTIKAIVYLDSINS